MHKNNFFKKSIALALLATALVPCASAASRTPREAFNRVPTTSANANEINIQRAPSARHNRPRLPLPDQQALLAPRVAQPINPLLQAPHRPNPLPNNAADRVIAPVTPLRANPFRRPALRFLNHINRLNNRHAVTEARNTMR